MNVEPLMNYLADEEGPYGRVAMNGMPSYSPLLTSLLKKLLLLHLCLLLNWGERETGRGFFLFSACYCNTDKETLLFTTLFNRRAVRVFRNYYLMTNATKISTLKRTTKYVFINQMITISQSCVLNSARKKN